MIRRRLTTALLSLLLSIVAFAAQNRFFAGYAGWDHGQLAKEIKENSWLIGKAGKETLLNQHFRDLWHTSLNEMGGKYAIWARYPQYPSLN